MPFMFKPIAMANIQEPRKRRVLIQFVSNCGWTLEVDSVLIVLLNGLKTCGMIRRRGDEWPKFCLGKKRGKTQNKRMEE